MKNAICFLLLQVFCVFSLEAAPVYQSTGLKVGEVTPNSAVVWARLTATETRNATGVLRKGRPAEVLPDSIPVEKLEGDCPGALGKIRIWYQRVESLLGLPFKDIDNRPTQEHFQVTDWVNVGESTDYSHSFLLEGLSPSSDHVLYVETDRDDIEESEGLLMASFRTAPLSEDRAEVTFTVITGQMYSDTDRPDGFHIYPSMKAVKPDFLVATGDTVYYDNEDPIANTVAIARYHWHRMYGYSTLRDFHLSIPGYWIKDDHDTLSDDCWPGLQPEKMKPFSFEQGQRIFLEQVPMSEKTFRSFRWGKHLQIWLPEGRDFRSPNDLPDGPDKTILGKEQKEWLKKSLADSDADWKVLVSATPLVGPDRPSKGDNHANQAFAHEGGELRQWFQENCPFDLFVACGDRHWQYHSRDPKTGVEEFSCGPASDQHAGGFPEDPAFDYLWSRVEGGFLSVTVAPKGEGSEIQFRHHDVFGKVVHEVRREKKR